ncbi:MAG: hypothetical protein K9L95_00690 [Candidatus Omnitrophica bacterium]|nr:hypothetical protein [Candidatus Omnitrophota bacterium]MCF7892719.1 hypothetical protein [Candidatus Omnitrophota bacterium]
MKKISLIIFLFLLTMVIMPAGLFAEAVLSGSEEAAGADQPETAQALKELKKPKQIENLLEEKRKELKMEKKEYGKAKKSLKEAARTGFFGFGRSQEETRALVRAKKRVEGLKRGVGALKREINLLKKELSLARKIKILRERQKEIDSLL